LSPLILQDETMLILSRWRIIAYPCFKFLNIASKTFPISTYINSYTYILFCNHYQDDKLFMKRECTGFDV